LSLTSLAVCAALSASALAKTQIDFVGKVVPDSCTVKVDGSGTTVTLEDISVTDLGTNAGGVAAKEKAFTLNLDGCVPATGTAQVSFSQATASNNRLTNAVGAGYAKGVSLELRSLNGGQDSPLAVGTTANTSPVSSSVDAGFAISGGSGHGTYKVRYYNDIGNGVTPGKVEATAVATVNYL